MNIRQKLQVANRQPLTNLCAVVATVLALQGCASVSLPLEPDLPQTQWQTVEEVVRLDARPPTSQWVGPRGIISLGGKTVGIDEFSGNETGAPLASQVLTRKLISVLTDLPKKNRFNIVDRSTLLKRKSELQLVNDNFNNMDKGEKAKMLGKAIAADYLLDGSVVEYSSDQKVIHLKNIIKTGEIQRYEKDFGGYITKLEKLHTELEPTPADILTGQSTTKAMDRNRIEQAKKDAMSPVEFIEQNRQKTATETRNIASIGITARLIDVRTGEYVWLYQDEKRGFSLMDTMQDISVELVDSMIKKTIMEEQ